MSNQRIIPMLSYDDCPAALDFLAQAFGFEEKFRFPMPDGKIGHAEIGFADNVVMVASSYEPFGLTSPRNLPLRHSQIFCLVDDVDAHFRRARAAGATIAAEPEDQPHGHRMYRALDPEGHRWIFAASIKPS